MPDDRPHIKESGFLKLNERLKVSLSMVELEFKNVFWIFKSLI